MALSPSVDCGGNYTTPYGLTFSIICDRDYDGWDIDSNGVDSIEDCFDQCSIYTPRTCGAVAFDSEESRCYFKTRNVTALGSNGRDGWVLGIADETQMQPYSSDCTETGANMTTQNGLDFTVYCGQRAVGSDLCTDSQPDCRAHVESLEECLEHCSTMHPLCTSVDWVPSFYLGWLNCFPKNYSIEGYNDARSTNSSIETARARLPNITDSCLSDTDGTLNASNGDSFQLTCNEDRLNNTIEAQHASSLTTCADLCTAENTGGCVGVVYDAGMVNGYENCYLKSATGVPVPDQSGITAAMRQISTNSSAPSSSTSTTQQPQGENRAWIAGPVVGTVAALTTMVAALWWWGARKRKRSTKKTTGSRNPYPQEAWRKPELEPESQQRLELDPETRRWPELDPDTPQRLELDPEVWQRPELSGAMQA